MADILFPLVLLVTTAFGPGQEAAQDTSPAALYDKAVATGRSGNFKQALSILSDLVTTAEKTGDTKLLARALVGLGWSQWGTGQYDTAYATHQRGLALFRQLEDAQGESFTLMRMGETLYSKGRFADALVHYDEALAANRRSKDRHVEGLIRSNQGSALRSMGRYDEAYATLESAAQIFREVGYEPGTAQVLTFMGLVNRARSEYAQAIESYTAAAAIRHKLGDTRGEAQTVGNLGNIYSDLGQYETAVDTLNRSQALAEEAGYTAQIGFNHESLGTVFAKLGRNAEALGRYERALDIWRTIDRKPQIGWTLREIGLQRLYAARDYPGARAAFEEALSVARAIADPEMEGYLHFDLGDVDGKSGHPERALHAFERALAFAEKIGSPNLEYEVLGERGRVRMQMGRHNEAIADLRAAVAIVNDLRSRVTSDASKVAFIDTRQTVFQDLAAALLEVARPAEALEIAEASRARAFADLLQSRQVKPRVRDRVALDDLRAAAGSRPSASSSSSNGTRGSAAVDDALSRLRVQDAELASLVTVESARVDEIRSTAARLKAAIVEYLVTDTALLVWVVTPSGEVHASRTVASSERIDALARATLAALNEAEGSSLQGGRGPLHELRALYDLAVAPIARWLPSDGELLVIVPHGPLALVPFAALTDEHGTPLIARFKLASAPSASVFRYTSAKRRELRVESGALILAAPDAPRDAGLPPLPGTRDEGQRVAARLAKYRPAVLEGSRASEHTVKQRIGDAAIVHFATHGLVSELRPADSSLVLAEGEGEDGYLRVSEVFGLDLDASLVVLSGCSTGRGKLTGDGIFGLSRAFIYAGTPSVLVSLWDVSDRATAFLMDRFYAEFVRTGDRAGALRAAQLATRTRYPHPALWAPFILAGEPR